MNNVSMLERAHAIAGPADMSRDGEYGRVEVVGAEADALINALELVPEFTQQFRGKVVRITREGGLELWCNGFYIEGTGVRRIVEKATVAMSVRLQTAAQALSESTTHL